VSFATITLCVASQRAFIVVYLVIDSVRKLSDTPQFTGVEVKLHTPDASPLYPVSGIQSQQEYLPLSEIELTIRFSEGSKFHHSLFIQSLYTVEGRQAIAYSCDKRIKSSLPSESFHYLLFTRLIINTAFLSC
jgi:hypothetical protein